MPLVVPKNSNFLTETCSYVKEAKMFIYSIVLRYNMLTLFDFCFIFKFIWALKNSSR